MQADHLPRLALAIGALLLAADVAQAETYGNADRPLLLGRVPNPSGPFADDLPAPPALGAPDRGAPPARYDYPGRYAQRFDGAETAAPRRRPPTVTFTYGSTPVFPAQPTPSPSTALKSK